MLSIKSVVIFTILGFALFIILMVGQISSATMRYENQFDELERLERARVSPAALTSVAHQDKNAPINKEPGNAK